MVKHRGGKRMRASRLRRNERYNARIEDTNATKALADAWNNFHMPPEMQQNGTQRDNELSEAEEAGLRSLSDVPVQCTLRISYEQLVVLREGEGGLAVRKLEDSYEVHDPRRYHDFAEWRDAVARLLQFQERGWNFGGIVMFVVDSADEEIQEATGGGLERAPAFVVFPDVVAQKDALKILGGSTATKARFWCQIREDKDWEPEYHGVPRVIEPLATAAAQDESVDSTPLPAETTSKAQRSLEQALASIKIEDGKTMLQTFNELLGSGEFDVGATYKMVHDAMTGRAE